VSFGVDAGFFAGIFVFVAEFCEFRFARAIVLDAGEGAHPSLEATARRMGTRESSRAYEVS
jgi:hypothetical protein